MMWHGFQVTLGMSYFEDHRLVQEIRLKLGYPTEQQAEMAISRVMFMLRNQLSPEQGDALLQHLPSNIMLLYVSAWKLDHSERVNRLDEFVNQLLAYEEKQAQRIFFSEIDVLRASLVILSALDRKYKTSNALPYLLSEDIRNATLHEVA